MLIALDANRFLLWCLLSCVGVRFVLRCVFRAVCGLTKFALRNDGEICFRGAFTKFALRNDDEICFRRESFSVWARRKLYVGFRFVFGACLAQCVV